MTQIIKAHGISEKVMTSAVECINRIAVTYKTGVEKIEVIEKYRNDNVATWQIMYTLTDGQWFTLMANRKAIY